MRLKIFQSQFVILKWVKVPILIFILVLCFPIIADIGSDVISESFSTSPEFDLEEATRTIHVEGKWISLKSEETQQHTIIDVGMPNSGDFIKYFVWCKN